MALALALALAVVAVVLSAARRTARPRGAAPMDPYMVWMMSNLPSLRSWRR